ncbi:MAG: FAD-binding protein [Oscillospiraceae bacterium]|nr:FAD-binding protein [Oscillospiraceae bacterium]
MRFIDAASEDARIQNSRNYPWKTPPPPIPEEKIAESVQADVIIVGGGISGLAAGARLTQLGIKTIVLEKSRGLVAHGAHVASVGSDIQRQNGVFIDKAQFARDWMRICGSRVNEDLLWLYINRSEEAFNWLLGMGGDNVYPVLFGGNYRGPDFTEYAGTHIVQNAENSKYRMFGALLVCEILEDAMRSGGGEILRETRAEQLEKRDGRVSAVIARGADGEYRRYSGTCGIVLATGDIGADRDMLEHFAPIGLLPKHNGYYPPGLNTGDGHKMGYWAGGAFEPAPWAVSLHLIAYAMYCFFFLHVNKQGRRYMNEDTWVQAKSIRTLMQPDGSWAFSVFDSKWYEEVARLAPIAGGQFTDSLMAIYGRTWEEDGESVRQGIERYLQNGLCLKADSIEELARAMEVPEDALAATVARYNQLHRLGNDDDYGKRAALLTSIDKPPYYALKWGPSLLNVFGGFLTDTKLRVLDETHAPVPGLYATGMIAGGLYGVDYPLLFNGNSNGRCLTWGLILADSIAEDKNR